MTERALGHLRAVKTKLTAALAKHGVAACELLFLSLGKPTKR